MTTETTTKKTRLPTWVRWPLFALWLSVLALICARLALPIVVDRWLTGLLSEQEPAPGAAVAAGDDVRLVFR